MKKVMIILVAVAMAIGTSAATIDWVGEITNTANGGTASASGSWYIFLLGGSNLAIGNDDFTINTATSEAWLFDGASKIEQIDPSLISLGKDTEWYSDVVGVVISNVQAKFTYEEMNVWWAIVLVDDATPEKFGVHTFKPNMLSQISSSLQETALNVGQFTVNIIPEPLTVGLALAGVALLIAQRRRK